LALVLIRSRLTALDSFYWSIFRHIHTEQTSYSLGTGSQTSHSSSFPSPPRPSMAKRPARSFRILALALFFICGSTFLLFHPNFEFGINDQLRRLSLGGANFSLHSSSSFQSSSPPSITIIAIWNPKSSEPPPHYLPNFFASVRANPKVHLLFVVFDKFYFGCDKRISPVEKNIREICFDTETYWRLHVDFLCEHWGCADRDKSPLLQTLARRGNNDAVRVVV